MPINFVSLQQWHRYCRRNNKLNAAAELFSVKSNWCSVTDLDFTMSKWYLIGHILSTMKSELVPDFSLFSDWWLFWSGSYVRTEQKKRRGKRIYFDVLNWRHMCIWTEVHMVLTLRYPRFRLCYNDL